MEGELEGRFSKFLIKLTNKKEIFILINKVFFINPYINRMSIKFGYSRYYCFKPIDGFLN